MKKVLAVDDSRTMLLSIEMTLSGAGFKVLKANNGREGLTVLKAQAVDAIITDINMPVMDGITFVKELRSVTASKKTPVIILTTESQSIKKEEGRKAGANGWVTKPFKPEQLVALVKRVTTG